MAIEVQVGDRVRLVGTGWAEDYNGYGVGDIVEVVEIDEYGGIWADEVGTVGKKGSLYTDDPDGPDRGVYAVELVTDKAKQGESSFDQKVRTLLDDMATLLVEKNTAYGNSALDPVRIFSKADTLEQLYVRLDDKINRVKQGHEFPGDDTIRDIIGYCTLILIAREG